MTGLTRLAARIAALIIASSLALMMAAPARAQSDRDVALAEAVAEFIAQERAQYDIPGVVIVLVENGETRLLEGYGEADLSGHVPMTPDTIVRAGSVSKLMTSLAVVDWLTRNGISLDAPVADYLGTLDLPRVAASRASFRQYLTHTAGYDDSIEALHTYDRSDWQGLRETLEARDAGPLAAPGRAVSYSSWPLAVLGAVLEEQTGQAFDAYMQDALFEPLGMSASSFAADREDYGAGLDQAVGYRLSEGRIEAVYPFNHVRLPPGIALRTTGRDMARYLHTVLSGDGPFAPGVMTAYTSPQVAHFPGARGRALGPSERFDHGWRALWHDGNGIGFVNRTYWIPELGFGFYISFNHALMEPGPTVSEATFLVNRFTDFILERRFAEGETGPEDVIYPTYLIEGASCDRPTGGAVNGFYRPANYPRRTLGRIASLFDGVGVSLDGEALVVGSTRYTAAQTPCLWESEQGRVIAWRPSEAGEPAALYLGAGAFLRAPLLEGPMPQLLFVGIILLGGLVLAGGWTFASRLPGLLRGGLAVAALLPAAGVVTTGVMLLTMDPQDLFLGQLFPLGLVEPSLLLAGGGTLAVAFSSRWFSKPGGAALTLLYMSQLALITLGACLALMWNLGGVS